MLLFLLSVGLTLIFGMLDVVNLAHGSLYMLGAYAGLTLIAAHRATSGSPSSPRRSPSGSIGVLIERTLSPPALPPRRRSTRCC